MVRPCVARGSVRVVPAALSGEPLAARPAVDMREKQLFPICWTIPYLAIAVEKVDIGHDADHVGGEVVLAIRQEAGGAAFLISR